MNRSSCIFQLNAPEGKKAHLLLEPNFEEPSARAVKVKRNRLSNV
jgi:hypothetical protein